MKKLISSLLFIGLLCSCADKTEDSDPYNERMIEGFPNLILHLDPEGIKLVNDGNMERLYTIKGDLQARLNEACKSISSDKSPVQCITIEDFDFDGYQDLFIPERLGTPNVPGAYYHFNPDKFRYDEWDEMNSLGLLVNADSDEKTLSYCISSSAVNYDTTVYKWSDGCLLPISREVQYADAHNDIYIDSYEYDENSEEILVRRERVILDEDNNWLGTEEIILPSEYSFSIDKDKIDVIYKNNVVQTLNCVPFSNNMITTEDYNFDGYDDLFVITDIQDVKITGIYYKFDPQTSLFEEWNELNDLGHTLDIGVSSKLSTDKFLSYSINTSCEHDTYVYKWQNGELILIEIRKTHIDQVKNTAFTEIYYIDAEGNETLIESTERDLTENPLDFD